MTGASAAVALPSRRGLARETQGDARAASGGWDGDPGRTRRDLDAMTLQQTDATVRVLSRCSA